jgi:hypothetical protein
MTPLNHFPWEDFPGLHCPPSLFFQTKASLPPEPVWWAQIPCLFCIVISLQVCAVLARVRLARVYSGRRVTLVSFDLHALSLFFFFSNRSSQWGQVISLQFTRHSLLSCCFVRSWLGLPSRQTLELHAHLGLALSWSCCIRAITSWLGGQTWGWSSKHLGMSLLFPETELRMVLALA